METATSQTSLHAGLGEKVFAIEVETADSITDAHTADQWRLLFAYANGYNAEFWIAVPGAASVAAKRRLRDLKLTGQVWGL